MLENNKIIPFEFKARGQRIFAIGDTHACPTELEALLNFLQKEESLSQDDNIIFVGDYINKGSEAKTSINLVLDFQKHFTQTIFLKGNHEDMLLGYLGFPSSYGDIFLRNGGQKTLDSYGIKPQLGVEETKSLFPKEHLEFFRSLKHIAISEDYIFVHAGLLPSLALTAQRDTDIYWIRSDFIQHTHKFGKTVIFGHTPFNEIWLDLPFKIGIDTGLVYKNMLSCVELTGKSIFQVKYGSSTVTRKNLP